MTKAVNACVRFPPIAVISENSVLLSFGHAMAAEFFDIVSNLRSRELPSACAGVRA